MAVDFAPARSSLGRNDPESPKENAIVNYVCLIYSPVARSASADEQQAERGAYMAFTEEARKSGAMTGGLPLQSQDTATTVRLRNGERIVTDGPFAETKEWLAGF